MEILTIAEMGSCIAETYMKDPKLNLGFVGDPGTGKSQMTEGEVRRKLAEALGRPDFFVHTVILSQMAQEDLTVPWPTAQDAERGIYRHLVHADFSFEENAVGILFLDEALSADPNVTKAVQNILSARKVHGRKLPDGIMIVIASNKKENRAGVNTHNTAFYNRVIWMEVQADYEGWEPWLRRNNIDESIRSFLKKFPQHMHDFKPDRMINATPRTWESVNKVLGSTFETALVIGCVGEGIANEFFAYRALREDFPDIKDVELTPEKAKVPKNADAQYALSNALASWTKKNNWSAFVKYSERMNSEYRLMYMREAARLHPELSLKSTKEWEKYVYENQKDLL